MKYKALVTDIVTKERIILEDDCKTKKQFLEFIRSNGYSVSDLKVKKADVWDWIVNETNCYPEDWYFNEIPESDEEYSEKIKVYQDRVIANKARAYANNQMKKYR